MADLTVNGEARCSGDWGAIWAGSFTFVGIWSVFGSLGLIIVPAANAGAARN
jgi:hypothetical protein